jgi:multicomponent Na+:H+ antiporter subunit D
MSPEDAILTALLLPLAGAALLSQLGRRPDTRDAVTLLTSILTFLTVLQLYTAVSGGGRPELDVVELFPGVMLGFKVEPLGMLFALVAAGLWPITSLYAIGYMRAHHEENQTRFFVCFAVAIAAALAIAFSRNLLTLFIFYEVLSLSTYPLVTHHGTPEAKRAGRIYLGILLTTSVVFMLLAILWTWSVAGTTEFTAGGILRDSELPREHVWMLLALFAFGAGKAALMPFHRWLPAAMVAPTPVSALLHAVAVVKAGVFTVMKVVVFIFGVDYLAETNASDWLVGVASFTMIAAACVAMTKDNLKARLAYSTISQLSYIVLGAALVTNYSVLGGGMHIAMHAVGKITLFFVAGALLVGPHKANISDMAGLGRKMPWTFGAFLIGSASIIGLPPLGGSWSKWYLVLGAVDAGQPLVVGVLMLSSLLAIGYLLPVVTTAFFAAPKAGDDEDHGEGGDGIQEAPILTVIPPVATAITCLLLFFYSGDLLMLLKGMGGP